ncbi:MAG: DapH/DapD/GlmU-related protein [Thermoplasmatota archaeon]
MRRYTGEKEKYDKSSHSIIRMSLLVITPIIVFSLSALPSVSLLSFYFLIVFPRIGNLYLTVFFLPFLLFISLLILILSTTFITGLFIKGFHITYKEGRYSKSIKDKNTFKFTLYYILYRPTVKLLSIIFIPQLYAIYLSLVGAKIGKHVFFGGRNTISDPCVVEIESNTLIGGGATIMGHLGEDKLVIKKVKIGSHCLVGAEALIMPGVTLEDKVVLGGKSLVTKNKTLTTGKMYGGVPAQEIKKNK